MKKFLSFILCFIFVFSIPVVVNASENTKLTPELSKALSECKPEDSVGIYLYFNEKNVTVENMPSWPDLAESRKELKEYYDKMRAEHFAVIFETVEYKEIYVGTSAVIVEVKAEDIQRLAEYDIIRTISLYKQMNFDPYEDLSQAYENLDALCWSAVYDYGVSSTNRNSAYKIEPGVLVLTLTNDSLERGREVLDETSDFLDSYSVEPEAYSYEDFKNQYAKLKNVLDSSVISKGALKSLINFCTEEKNDIGYYYEDLWSEFVEKLNNAQAIYDNDEIVEDYKVTEVYFELLHSHFKLCSSNTTFGDVDNDGEISILDATYVQRNLAKIEEINSSQKLISKSDILYATEIQRYIVKLNSVLEIENSRLDDFVEYTAFSNVHSQGFKFESWKHNYFYVDYMSISNYPEYL